MDAMRLLGSLMENRSTPAATDRLNNAYQQAAGSGPLGDLLARFGGPQAAGPAGGAGGLAGMLGGLLGQAGGGQQSVGGLLGGLADMARRAAGTAGTELQRNNPAAVGGAGALAGALLGGGRGAIGGGVMAVLGSLAVNAIQQQLSARGEAAAAPAPAPQQPARTDQPATAAAAAGMAGYHRPEDVHRKALLMLRAMIQAAKCDGQIDPQEMTRILGELDESGEGPDARAYVLKEMTAPVDIDGLARAVTSPTEAAEVYAASLMAIEVDSQAERDYLGRLAGALGLSPEVVAHINTTLNVRA